MRVKILAAAVVAALALSGTSARAQEAGGATAIVGGMVFDGTGAQARPATVLIEGERIVAVGSGISVPPGATVIDAAGRAVLPGFIDVHTHWTPGGSPATTPQIATAYVQAGVTTVADFHEQPESYEPRRAWLKLLATPHVAFAARVSTPGGHGADWADRATTIPINTPEAARAAIASLEPYRPDLIKAFTDGWRYGSSPDNTSMDQWTLSALAQEAHRNNWPVLTHTVTVERGLVAARSEVDSLAHGIQDRRISAEEVSAVRATDMAIAPTLAVYDPDKPRTTPVAQDDPRYQRSLANFANNLANVKALHDAGVPIALGTDAGMTGTPHGTSTLREMELLVKAGLPPAQALVAGTQNSAKVLRIDEDRGTLEAGKRADIVIVDGAPWADISDVFNVRQVLIDGRLVSGEGAPPLPPANHATWPASVTVPAMVDDFERADGRSSLDTLRLESPDRGLDRTLQVTQVVPRDSGGHALALSARMAAKDDAYAGFVVPLTRGSVVPADLGAYEGMGFDLSGEGEYIVRINGLDGSWETKVTAARGWKTFEIPFDRFEPVGSPEEPGRPFTGDGIVQVEIGGTRPAGRHLWVQVDNIRFY